VVSVDRKKELITVRGFQVAPPELEGLLLGHPDIVDAAVIGVPSGGDSDLPRAYVVRVSGSNTKVLTEEVVKEWVGSRLARYKRLEGGVEFVDAIPKNASGKVCTWYSPATLMSMLANCRPDPETGFEGGSQERLLRSGVGGAVSVQCYCRRVGILGTQQSSSIFSNMKEPASS
jgi:hypothetical protein